MRANGIPPLVALIGDGTQLQRQAALHVLAQLSEIEENRVQIADEGAIRPLARLSRSFDHNEKTLASFVIQQLALNADNRAAMVRAGLRVHVPEPTCSSSPNVVDLDL